MVLGEGYLEILGRVWWRWSRSWIRYICRVIFYLQCLCEREKSSSETCLESLPTLFRSGFRSGGMSTGSGAHWSHHRQWPSLWSGRTFIHVFETVGATDGTEDGANCNVPVEEAVRGDINDLYVVNYISGTKVIMTEFPLKKYVSFNTLKTVRIPLLNVNVIHSDWNGRERIEKGLTAEF